MTEIVAGLDAVNEVITELGRHISKQNGAIFLLQGDLASGKTTLVQAFAHSAGISSRPTSPTFGLMQVYEDKIYHYDLYNHGKESFLEHGLLEGLENGGIHFVEWPDSGLLKLLVDLGLQPTVIEITPHPDGRCYRIYDA